MKIENVPAGDIFPKLKGNAAKLKLPKGVFDPKDEDDVRLETLVPKEDPFYLFPGIHVVPLLVVAQNRDNILIVGPTGVGKTILGTQLGHKLHLPVTRLNFHGELGAPELLGYYGLTDPNIKDDDGWKYTALIKALGRPGIIMLDEWDAGRAELTIALQRMLEDNDPGVFLSEKDEFIRRHEDCIVIATANTRGLGDETGLYAGTGSQNYAQLNRFHLVMEVEPLPVKNMEAILKKAEFNGRELKPELVEALSEFYGLTLSSFKASELSAPVSVRTMLHFAEYFQTLGFAALELAVTSKMPSKREQNVVIELADRVQLADPKRKTA